YGGSGFWWRTHKYPLDGFERTSGNPLLSYSNWLTRVFYGDLKIAHLSGSDSHLASAVGSVATAFKGRGAADFRRAVESRRTWPVKLSVTILQLLAYARSSFEIITRHRRIMRESKSEIATTAEHLFWQELMHFDVANLGELRRRVLDNYLSIQKEASLD
ncbi:MAG: hypothetical protein M1548_02185, partial [Actinobacteria bacterium]|nr:hypothetical protein [Actinomycetota bacterium]